MKKKYAKEQRMCIFVPECFFFFVFEQSDWAIFEDLTSIDFQTYTY